MLRKITGVFLALLVVTGCSSQIENEEIASPPLPEETTRINYDDHPIILIDETQYIRPDIIQISKDLQVYSDMITVVENGGEAVNYADKFISLYSQTTAMKDLAVVRFLAMPSDSSLSLEVNFWANYKEDLDSALLEFIEAVESSKHASLIQTAIGSNYMDYIQDIKLIPSSTDYYSFLVEEGTNYYMDRYDEVLQGFYSGQGERLEYNTARIVDYIVELVDSKNLIAVEAGYEDYKQLSLSEKGYSKGQMDTILLNIKEYYSPLALLTVEEFSSEIPLVYSRADALFGVYLPTFSDISISHNSMVEEFLHYNLLDYQPREDKIPLDRVVEITYSKLPLISANLSGDIDDIRNYNYLLGRSYYSHITSEKPTGRNNWLIDTVGRIHVYLGQAGYDSIYPSSKDVAVKNDYSIEIRSILLNAVIYELEQYIYTAENLTSTGVEDEFNRLYSQYFVGVEGQLYKESAYVLALYQIIFSPFSSGDQIIGGVVALDMSMIDNKDTLLKRLSSLLILSGRNSVKDELSSISQASPFTAVTFNTTAYYVKSILEQVEEAVVEEIEEPVVEN